MRKKPAQRADLDRSYRNKRGNYRAEMEACLRKTDFLLKRQIKGKIAPTERKIFNEICTEDNNQQSTKEIKVISGLIEQHFEIDDLLDQESPNTAVNDSEIVSEPSEEIHFVVPGPLSDSDYSDDFYIDLPDTSVSEVYTNTFIIDSEESNISFSQREPEYAKQFTYSFHSDDLSSSKERDILVEFADDIGPTWEDKRKTREAKRRRIGSAIIKTFNTSSSGCEIVPEFIEDLFHASSATDSDDNRSVSLERISRSSSFRYINVSQSLPRIPTPGPLDLDPGLSILQN